MNEMPALYVTTILTIGTLVNIIGFMAADLLTRMGF